MMGTTDVDRCDRCGRILGATGYSYRNKDGRQLLLCDEDMKVHDPALSKQGWACELLDPPEPEAVSAKIAGTCKTCGGPQFHRFVKATPDAPAVKVTHCKRCDTRTCNAPIPGFFGGSTKCDSKAMRRDDQACPKGHPLMKEDGP